MTESTWTVTARDGAKIFGITNTPEQSRGRHVVMVHGLACTPYDYQHKRVADALCEKGYDVHRLALYWDEDENRKLHECTLEIHADDVNDVIAAKCADAEKIFLTGHSYGGTTVMIANPKADAVSLWDPSFDLNWIWTRKEYEKYRLKSNNTFYGNFATRLEIGNKMLESSLKYDEQACLDLATNFNKPVQVVFAGDGNLVKKENSYHSRGHKLNCSESIPGTKHCFYEGNTCEELIKKTINWFEGF